MSLSTTKRGKSLDATKEAIWTFWRLDDNGQRKQIGEPVKAPFTGSGSSERAIMEWKAQGPDAAAERNCVVYCHCEAGDFKRDLKAFDVYFDWLEVTTVDENGQPLVHTEITYVDDQNPEGMLVRSAAGGKAKIAPVEPGKYELRWGHKVAFLRWADDDKPQSTARKAVLRVVPFSIAMAWPQPGAAHKQYTNHRDDLGPEYGGSLPLQVRIDGPFVSGSRFYVKAEYDESNFLREGTDPAPAMPGEWVRKSARVYVRPVDASLVDAETSIATVPVPVGFVGGDKVKISIGLGEDCTGDSVSVTNWRKLFFASNEPLADDVKAKVDKSFADVFVEFVRIADMPLPNAAWVHSGLSADDIGGFKRLRGLPDKDEYTFLDVADDSGLAAWGETASGPPPPPELAKLDSKNIKVLFFVDGLVEEKKTTYSYQVWRHQGSNTVDKEALQEARVANVDERDAEERNQLRAQYPAKVRAAETRVQEKQLAYTQAEQDVPAAEKALKDAETLVNEAELRLDTLLESAPAPAEDSAKPQESEEITKARDDLKKAKEDRAQANREVNGSKSRLKSAKRELDNAKGELSRLKSGGADGYADEQQGGKKQHDVDLETMKLKAKAGGIILKRSILTRAQTWDTTGSKLADGTVVTPVIDLTPNEKGDGFTARTRAQQAWVIGLKAKMSIRLTVVETYALAGLSLRWKNVVFITPNIPEITALVILHEIAHAYSEVRYTPASGSGRATSESQRLKRSAVDEDGAWPDSDKSLPTAHPFYLKDTGFQGEHCTSGLSKADRQKQGVNYLADYHRKNKFGNCIMWGASRLPHQNPAQSPLKFCKACKAIWRGNPLDIHSLK